MQIIASTVGQSQTAIQRLLETAAEDTAKRLEPGLSYLARQGLIGAPVAYEKSKAVKRVLEALQGQATETTNLCNTTMLYKARDAYQGLAQRVADLAHDILNRNTAAAITGAESRQQAMQRAIREFNEKGIAAFIDKRGREWTPEAYVGMAMRTTSGNCATQMQMARCDDCGVDLVEVDSHAGARPKCARDQGKIFDRSNRSSKYPHWNTSSYGEPDGLLGINCGHHIYPYIEGVSARRYFPMDEDELEANDELYKEIQKQRALERDVRKQKRECMLFQELGDDVAFNDAAVKLKEKEARLTAHIKGNDQLHRRRDREQVAGYDRSVSAKAVAADRTYTRAQNTDTIPLKDTVIRKAVGAKAKNYEVIDPETGDIYHFVEGTRIQDSEVFAGSGTRHPLHEGVAEGLSEQFGGKPSKWQHCKGHGVLDYDGEERPAEVHWFQEETVGKVRFKVKRWEDEG